MGAEIWKGIPICDFLSRLMKYLLLRKVRAMMSGILSFKI